MARSTSRFPRRLTCDLEHRVILRAHGVVYGAWRKCNRTVTRVVLAEPMIRCCVKCALLLETATGLTAPALAAVGRTGALTAAGKDQAPIVDPGAVQAVPRISLKEARARMDRILRKDAETRGDLLAKATLKEELLGKRGAGRD